MLQVTLDKPGVFRAADVPEPHHSADHALVRVHRIGVCGTDLHAFANRQPFFSYPRILGHELGVEVLHAPDNDHAIRPGDHCSVEPYLNCGHCVACRRGKTNCCAHLKVMGVHLDGGMRLLLNIPVNKLHRSDQLSFDQLALVETLAVGAHAVERADPQPDETALVVGAGPIGLGVLQSLQARGIDAVVMDVNQRRLQFCRRTMHVTRTVDATADDLDEQLRAAAGGDLPTLVLDATGHPESMARAFDLVSAGGRIVFVGIFQGDLSFHNPDFHKRELTILATRNATADTFTDLIRRIEKGRINTDPWITHRLALAQVPEIFCTLPGADGLIKAMIQVDEAATASSPDK